MQARLLVLVLSALAVLPGKAHAAPTEHQGKVVPSQMCRGLWIVPVSYGDHPDKTIRLILDTGANVTSVDPDAIERVTNRRIRAGRKIRLKNGEAGPLKINSMKVTSHEMDKLSRALGADVDGILGFRTFRSMLLTLDYLNSEIRVANGELPKVDDLTIFRDYGKSRPFVPLTLAGAGHTVLVDSGATGGLTLRDSDVTDWLHAPIATSGSVRYKTIQLNSEGRAQGSWSFGPLTIDQPIVKIANSGSRLAGFEILQRFVWTFDQHNNRIRMQADPDEPILMKSVAGTGLILNPKDEGFEVVRVLDGMPGDKAGVQKGDVIVAIDDTPVYERGCNSVAEKIPGEIAIFSVQRDDDLLSIAIEMAVLVP